MDLLKPTEEELVEFHTRLDKVRQQMLEDNVQLMIISSMENIFYLSNYQTVGMCVQVLLVSQDDIHIITRELEASNAQHRSHVSYSFYDESQNPISVIVNRLKTRYTGKLFKSIGMEFNTNRLTYGQFNMLQKELLTIYPHVTFSDVSLIVSTHRLIKSTLEISKVKRAAQMVHVGLQAGIANSLPGMTETAIGGIISEAMCREGCEYTAYPVFLCSGQTGCMGHYTPTQKIVQKGEVLFFEIGGCFNRYHAARMYSIYVGEEVPEWFTSAETLLRKAVEIGRSLMIPGAAAKYVDKAMRDVIADFPYSHKQSERSGYSIGIGFYTDWSNSLFFVHPTSDKVFEENMTIHLIPWIQVPEGAIGFSDTVLVTREGGKSLFDGHYYKRSDK